MSSPFLILVGIIVGLLILRLIRRDYSRRIKKTKKIEEKIVLLWGLFKYEIKAED